MKAETILSFYTVERGASVSLHVGDQLIGELESGIPNKHAEFVTMAAQDLLAKARLKPSALQGLVTCHGPGSFTGIRVSVSMAKALSYSLNLPIWSTDSIRTWRSTNAPGEKIFVVLNAHKNLFYSSEADGAPLKVLEHSQVQAFLSEGYGEKHWVTNCPELFDTSKIRSQPLVRIPKASDLWRMRREVPDSGSTYDWKSFAPLYIRSSEAEESNTSSG